MGQEKTKPGKAGANEQVLAEIAHTSHQVSGKGLKFLLLIRSFSSEKEKCPDHCVYSETAPPACLKTRETLAKRCWPCTSRKGELGLAKQLRKTGKICNYYIFMAFCESFKTDRYQAKLALKEVEQRVADTKCSMMAVFFEYQGLVSILVIGILYIFKQRHLVTRHCEPYHARMQCLKCEGLGTFLPS